MIKDSKIIGTKIVAPFGWKKFKVGELFDVIRSVNDDFSLLTISYDDRVDGVSYVNCSTAGINNNGCPLVIERKYVNLENVLHYGITVSANGANTGSVFVQSSDFIVLQDSYCLILKSGNKNVFVYQFLATLLFKYKIQFNYQTKASWTRLSTLSISLPVLPNSQPDFAWMEQYMKLVQEDYLKQKELSNQAEIKAYLTESHTDSLEITDADREFLHEFDKLPRQKFKVGELFDVKLSQSDNKLSELPKGDIPLISAGVYNQGIVGYIGNDLLNTTPFENSITADMFGNWFLHVGDFYTVSHGRVNILVPKFTFNELFCEYICVLGSKRTCGYYGFDNMLSSKKLIDLDLGIPVRPDFQVDFESIEKYMQIQVKPLINKVAETLVPIGGA